MAIDNTPPRLRLIVTIAIIVVITLVGLDFVFKSYYAYMTDMAQREKLAPPRERDESRKAEEAALTSGKVPIDQAMAQLAKGSRTDVIEPRPSDDLGPMTGWTKMPKPAPQPAQAGHGAMAPTHTGDTTAENADAGGVPGASDGGTGLRDPGTAAHHAGAPSGVMDGGLPASPQGPGKH